MKMENCPQAENLVAYLYSEANDDEKKIFEGHLSSCVSCKEELAAFGVVRESVVEWRNDVMSNIITPAFANQIIVKQERKRSAIAAIREFFTLSPAWLQGATAFAALALIALITFAAIQLIGNKGNNQMAGDKKPSVENPSPNESPSNPENKIAKDAPTPIAAPKDVDKDEVQVTNKQNSTVAMKPKSKTPRHIKRTPRLKDEEIFGDQMAYNEEDDSLRLSSLNPNE
jgi:hypothetical protein